MATKRRQPVVAESSLPTEFSGEIVVASKIVDYLSSGLYESPAACLKELINNSYDADATEVKVFVQPDADRIIISDNGTGMNRVEFEHNFRRISETHKRDDSDFTKSGRPKIGKIGIGFIAANEICDVMEIESTKKGSLELIHVVIDFARMRDNPGDRRRDKDDLAKGDYYGKVLTTSLNSHYTRIFLRNVRGGAKQILVGASSVTGHSGRKYSLYGETHKQVAHDLSTLPLTSWSDFDPYSETMLQVGLNVPVKYHDTWMPPGLRARIGSFEREVAALNFSVFYDGTDLRKPVVFKSDQGDAFVRLFSFSGSAVSAKGYFYVQHGVLKPQDLNGLLIRIRHAAIGGYDQGFMSFPTSKGTLFQKWISAEIWASDELEGAMNIDRKTLRVAHPAYVQLQKAVHDTLADVLASARDTLYQERSNRRNVLKADEAIRRVTHTVSGLSDTIGKDAVRSITTAWREMARQPTGKKEMLQKFSVADLYELIIEVAQEILPPRQFSRFLTELTRRLTRQ